MSDKIARESDNYPNYEGRTGASPREIKLLLMNAAQSVKYHCLSPFAVFDELEDLVRGVTVYEFLKQEPLPGDHPLWTLPNVLLTPHMAGHGPYLDERRFEIMADNCRAFAAGLPLRNQVDKASWF